MKNTTTTRTILKYARLFLVIFVIVAFTTTCCTMLFVSTLRDTLELELTSENIGTAAKTTFVNVVLLSLLFTIIDIVRKKLTVERPVRQITQAARQLTQGNFSVRIPLTKQLRNDDVLRPIAECFNQLARELGSVETLRTDFIANVSHELKTPLAVMSNYATMLQRPGITEQEKQEYADAIGAASRRLAQLIGNILKLNKLENQQIFPKTEEFDLSEQLRECLLQFEDAWEEKVLNIEADIDEEVSIRSDEELLSLVWNNLISNAVKFTPRGGTVSVCLRSDAELVTVSVSDTGCGMTAETGRHIFEKFYQGDTSHTDKGNGLGLALVKRVVDILRAKIEVRSDLGQGSTFTVTLRRR